MEVQHHLRIILFKGHEKSTPPTLFQLFTIISNGDSAPNSSNMKFILICALVAVAVTSIDCLPKKGENRKCNTMCASIYDPVCAQDRSVMGSRPRTFGSKCVMEAHNCEHTAFMEVLYQGECKGSGGVRIS